MRNPDQVRWMIRRDMEEVLAIESSVNPQPWCEEDFLEFLRKRNCIGMVAEDNAGKINGWMIYELEKTFLNVVRIEASEREAATGMIAKLIHKLSQRRRTRFIAHVRESDLAMLFVMRDAGCRGIGIERQFFGPNEDSVVMEYRLDAMERVNAWESVPIAAGGDA